MTINLQNLNEIEHELESYTLTHARLSKIKAIRKIYNRIEEALDSGLTIHLLCDYLNQKGLEISPNYLYLILHRIRKEKERDNKSIGNKEPERTRDEPPVFSSGTARKSSGHSSLSSTNVSENKEESEADKEVQELLERFYSVNGLQERYKALGGDLGDFQGKSTSEQRQLVTILKTKVIRNIQLKYE